MIPIILVFDIDYTLRDFETKAWMGSEQQWQELCEDLLSVAKSHHVSLFFGIATAKSRVDDLVLSTISALSNYLHIREGYDNPLEPIEKNNMFHIDWDMRPHINHKDSNCSFKNYNTSCMSSVQVGQGSKIKSLYRIGKLYSPHHIHSYAKQFIYLVDDTPGVLCDVRKAGYSIIPACNVFSTNKVKQNQNVGKLIRIIRETIIAQIVSIAPTIHSTAKAGDHRLLKKILKEKPETVDHVDMLGNTALHIAISGGHMNCVKALVKANARQHPINAKNNSALEVAENSKNKLIVFYLEYSNQTQQSPLEFIHEKLISYSNQAKQRSKYCCFFPRKKVDFHKLIARTFEEERELEQKGIKNNADLTQFHNKLLELAEKTKINISEWYTILKFLNIVAKELKREQPLDISISPII